MKSEKILNAIGEIDDELISGAANDTQKRKPKNWLKWGSLAAAMVLCVGVGALGATLLNGGSRNPISQEQPAYADSIVMLDVNPSIALTVNADERIVRAEGLNQDGAAILNGMDLADVELTVAVNAVIGSMLQKGYLSDLQNAILVSVENDDAEKSAALKERISTIIGNALQDGNLDGSILSQTLNETAALEQFAQEYGISPGKAALIQEVLAQDLTLTAEKLAPLSITEIALISQSKNLTPVALTQNGAASDKAYISREDALAYAYNHAGVNANDVAKVEVEFDSDDGIMIYEVEFNVGPVEYECEIDARTGRVLKYETENNGFANREGNGSQPSDTQQPAQGQTSTATQQPAQDQAPATSQQPAQGQNPSDTQQPAQEQAPAATQQPAQGQNPSDTQQPPQGQASIPAQQPGSQYIGEEAAKEAALANAGIAADTVAYINAWLKYDDGRPEHYEVEFMADNTRYEYEIDLYSGAILAHEMETFGNHNTNHNGNQPSGSTSSADIGADAAVTAALSHAGLSKSQIRELETDYDYDDGVAVYEIEFEYGDYEYEYKIDAATGAILEYEIDD